MRRLWFLTVLLALAPGALFAQAPLRTPSEPPEWGEVSREVLRADTYPADTNASSVILSEVGDGRFLRDGDFEVEHHARIKILDEGGYESGTVTAHYYAADNAQHIDDVEGVTYTLDEQGNVQTHELDDDDVFTEEVDEDYEQIRFTLPNLEPGAVIEYRYEFVSESLTYLRPWTFQHAQPTLRSAYEVEIPSFLEYVTVTTGSQDYDTVDKEVTDTPSGTEVEMRWVMTDLPAIHEEPYMTTPEDYRSRLRLQLRLFRNPRTGVVQERFMTSWPDLADRLLDADHFGKDLGDGGGGLFGGEAVVEAEVGRLVEDAETDSAKMHAIYDYMRSAVEWNGKTTWARDRDFDEILESKAGTSGEVNLLLVSMLKNAGVEAHPVMISTRDHGTPIPTYPLVRQFNSVIAAVNLPNRDEWVLLDATEPLCPASMLPERDLNGQGWLVRTENPIWIDLPPTAHTKRRVYVRGTLEADGTMAGTIHVTDGGYNALESRRILEGKEGSSFLTDKLLGHLSDVSVTDVAVKHADSVAVPVSVNGGFRLPAYGQRAGDMLYVNPILSPSHSENPFTAEERTFPIDFAYPRRTSYTVILTLPDGYTVKEVPKNERARLADGKGRFVRLVQARGNQITVRVVMALSTPRIRSNQYDALRKFFTHVVSAQSAQIVLEKTEGGAEAPASSSSEGNR